MLERKRESFERQETDKGRMAGDDVCGRLVDETRMVVVVVLVLLLLLVVVVVVVLTGLDEHVRAMIRMKIVATVVGEKVEEEPKKKKKRKGEKREKEEKGEKGEKKGRRGKNKYK